MKVNPCQQCRKSRWEFSECCSKYILLVMHHQSWNVAEARVSIWNWSTWWHRQETASGVRIRVRIGSKRVWKKKGNQKERRGVKIWNKEKKKIWKLEWGWWMCFQNGTLTWLLAGVLCALPCGSLHRAWLLASGFWLPWEWVTKQRARRRLQYLLMT